MDSSEKLLGFLGLCRRAGKLTAGFDSTKDKIQHGQVWLALLASDSSYKTKKEIQYYCDRDMVPVAVLPLDRAQIAGFFGREIAVFGILDSSFAKGIQDRLNQMNREETNA